MAITAAMVKELREMTGAGMMDCKKALTNTDGDMDAAVEFLRENGLAKAAKKAGRIAAEGLVAVAVSEDAKEAAIVEVNSETDFVAKNDTFRTYVAEVADQALTTKAADIEGFLAEESKAEAGKTVKEALDGKIAVIGENLNIRRFAKVSAADGFVASYIHAGGKIGVLVEVATDGDMDKAVEFLREKGLATAQKKAGRIAAEGIVMLKVSEDGKKAVAVEVNAETDFVAKNEKFQGYVAQVAELALNTKAADIDAFMEEEWTFSESATVKEELAHQIATIGENMNIRRFTQVTEENGFVASYTHMGGKIGVLVDVETDVVNDAVKEMAKNVAMQVAAISPKYTSRDEVSKDYIEHETEILKVQAMNENPDKPENIIEKMIVGRLNKELKEVCLLDQAYVKAEDGKQAVGKYVEQVAKANGANVTIKGFVRFETGEGIEKKEEDFAAEVAAQLK